MPSQDYTWSAYTPLDNTGRARSVFKSAYKNIRFANSVRLLTERPISEAEAANLPGLSFNTYGVVDFWRILLAYNGIQDAIQDVYAGMTFRFPTKASVIAWLTQQQNNAPVTRII